MQAAVRLPHAIDFGHGRPGQRRQSKQHCSGTYISPIMSRRAGVRIPKRAWPERSMCLAVVPLVLFHCRQSPAAFRNRMSARTRTCLADPDSPGANRRFPTARSCEAGAARRGAKAIMSIQRWQLSVQIKNHAPPLLCLSAQRRVPALNPAREKAAARPLGNDGIAAGRCSRIDARIVNDMAAKRLYGAAFGRVTLICHQGNTNLYSHGHDCPGSDMQRSMA